MSENLDYADNITLAAHTHQHIIQDKTSKLEAMNIQVVLNINLKKSEIMKIHLENQTATKINDQNNFLKKPSYTLAAY